MYVYFCVYKVLYLLKKTLKKTQSQIFAICQKKTKIYINIYFKKSNYSIYFY